MIDFPYMFDHQKACGWPPSPWTLTLRYIHANTAFLDQLISIIHWLNHVKADFFDVESHHFGRSNSSPMAFLTACDFMSGWPSGWPSENKWPFSMMSQPMRKPGMPQGLERPDKTMELRRPALLGAAPSPRMAVYILGWERPGEAPGEAPTWGDMGR